VEKERPSSQPTPRTIATLETFIEWLEERSNQGNGEAHALLAGILYGHLYHQLRKEEEEESTSIETIAKLKILAQQGNEYAQAELVRHWRDHEGEQKALLKLQQLARKGNQFAHEVLIKSLIEGKLGQKERALKDRLHDLRQHAKHNDPVAQKHLMRLLEGVVKSRYLLTEEKGWRKFFALKENQDLRKEILEDVKDFALLGNRKAQKFIAEKLSDPLQQRTNHKETGSSIRERESTERTITHFFDVYNALLGK